MPNSRKILLAVSILLSAVALVSAQPSKNDLNNPNISSSERDRIAEQLRQQAAERQARNTEQVAKTRAETGNAGVLPPGSVSEENRLRAAQIERYKGALEKMQKAPAAYHLKFAELLKSKKMNIVRLYPDKKCDLLWASVISAAALERCRGAVPAAGGGSRYSFEKKSNYRFGAFPADIHFSDDNFIVGNDFARGIIANLGDVDLLKIDLNSQVLNFVRSFEPQTATAEVARQNALLEKGFDANGVVYANRAAVELNSTYVMRAIAYQPSETNPAAGRVTGKLSRPLSDVSVAFKVVGVEPDEGIVLLWKKLD